MLLVKTYFDKSQIEGFGIFAAEKIKAGTPVWRFQSNFDLILTTREVEALPQLAREFIDKYASLSSKTGNYVLYGDDTRFINHSFEANTVIRALGDESELGSVASKDIGRGEELTIDYRTFDELSAHSQEAYLQPPKV